MLGGGGGAEFPEKNHSEQSTNKLNPHIASCSESNQGHTGGRRVVSPLRHNSGDEFNRGKLTEIHRWFENPELVNAVVMFISIVVLNVVFSMLNSNHLTGQFGGKTWPMGDYTST